MSDSPVLSEGAKITLLYLLEGTTGIHDLSSSVGKPASEMSEQQRDRDTRLQRLAKERPSVEATHMRDNDWWLGLHDALAYGIDDDAKPKMPAMTGSEVLSILPDRARKAVEATIKEREKAYSPDGFLLRKMLRDPVNESEPNLLWETVLLHCEDAAYELIEKSRSVTGDDYATNVLLASCQTWFADHRQDNSETNRHKICVLGALKSYADMLESGMLDHSDEYTLEMAQVLKRGLLASIGMAIHYNEIKDRDAAQNTTTH